MGWFVVGALVAVFIMWTQARALGGWTALLAVGEGSPMQPPIAAELESLVTLERGNDGQITYLIARDPWGDRHVDLVPQAPLRWRRLLFPGVAGLFGTLEGSALFWSMVTWSAVSLGGAAAALRSILHNLGASAWAMIGLLANPGVWVGFRIMTPDPMGLALGLVGVALVLQRRDVLSILAFTLAVIAKEPYLLFAAATGAWRFFAGERRRGLVLFGVPAIGLLAWTAVMTRIVPGEAFETGNIAFPLAGIIRASRWWPDIPVRENVGTGLALVMLAIGIVALLRVKHPFLRWHLAAWTSLALITSEWVWRFGNGNLRAFAPIGIFLAIAAGLRQRESRSSRIRR